jgi:hypothetical protein
MPNEACLVSVSSVGFMDAGVISLQYDPII